MTDQKQLKIAKPVKQKPVFAYKQSARPMADKGISFKGVPNILVPDQGMSLNDILKRFTRGEAVPVGQPVHYEDAGDRFDIDVEKMQFADMTERAEFSKKLQEVRDEYDRQMKEKAKADKAKAEAEAKKDFEKRVRIAARKQAKQSSKPSA